MNCTELLHIKADLLCYGLRADKETKQRMELVNPYVSEKCFMHAAHLLLGGLIVNTCISEEYCKKSPYEIRVAESGFSLYKEDCYITPIKVLPLPDWCKQEVNGYRIGDYLRPHSNNCIACWPYLRCNFYAKRKQCKFCSMGDYRIKTILDQQTVITMIQTALAANPEYEVALSGGTCPEPDHTIKYYSEICKGAREAGAKYISVETAPPDDLTYLDILKASGATALIMNLEIADYRLRKIICPGKSEIHMRHYYKAYKHGVEVFGKGNVSCVLIAGIQPAELIIKKAKQLISMGVIPTIIPFKPLDGCQMKTGYSVADPTELIMISTEIDKMLDEHGLLAAEQKGCTKCNGCSLETAVAESD